MKELTDESYKLHTGNAIPVIGFGTWALKKDPVESVVDAIEQGYPLIDTSGDYGTQPFVGEGVKKSGYSRKELYIVTKVEAYEDTYESAKNNLAELDMEQADLMLIHWPPSSGDAGVDLWKGLIKAKAEGISRDIGVSNYNVQQTEKLKSATGELPAVNQVEWTPFGHDMDLYEYCRQNGIIMQSYSPLTRGKRLDDETLKTVADKHNKSPAQVLIRWNIEMGIIPLIKAADAEHRKENIDVFDFHLDEEDMDRLATLNQGYSAIISRPAYMR